MNNSASQGTGIRGALRQTAKADEVIRKLLNPHKPKRDGLAILAVGGYGRGDNSSRSDLDIIVLHRGNIEPHEQAIRQFIQNLWDKKWSPAQSLLRLEDIDRDFLAIPDRASALLESRFVWGDPAMARGLELRLGAQFDVEVWEKFLEAKIQEFKERRRHFSEVPRVVEPNLKSQAGGLRDLHHVFWLERAWEAWQANWLPKKRRSCAIVGFLNRMHRAGLLTLEEMHDMQRAFDHMLRTREALRQLGRKEEDLLVVPMQPKVGKYLGYEGEDREIMQNLMRDTLLAMEKIYRFANEFSQTLAEYGLRKLPAGSRLPVMLGAQESMGKIELEDDVLPDYAEDPAKLLLLVSYGVIQNTPLSGKSRHELRRAIRRTWMNRQDSIMWINPLLHWTELTVGFGARFRKLSALDAISPWLREWNTISGLTTGSYYHEYTVDEHTIRALEALDNLPSLKPAGLPQSLWETLENRELVYWSIIFHDIAKGSDGDHCYNGAIMAKRALQRMNLHHIAEKVAKLVFIHLRMEQIAFRRDISDPENIKDFATLVGDLETLNALYLLTVCDLRAVRKGVWTPWKGRLLTELYQATEQHLEMGKDVLLSVSEEARKVADLVDDKSVESRVRDFLNSMQEEYRRVVPAEEIARHMQAAEEVQAGEKFRWIINDRDGYIELTLVTHDRMGLLADAAGLMVSRGVGVREARIFTRDDGIVIDRFRAEDNEPHGVPIKERIASIPRYWKELQDKKIKISDLISQQARRTRLIKKPVALVEAEIAITHVPDGYLIDISGPDKVGLLYQLCSTFSSEGLDVRAARVSARIDGIVDAFLVQDPKGMLGNIEDKKRIISRLQGVSTCDID